MVVEDVAADIREDGLTAGGVNVAVGAVDEFAAAVDEIFAGFVGVGALGVGGAADADAVSIFLLV